ncbi:MAG: glycosyltransferase [Pseudomonadota bacterium]
MHILACLGAHGQGGAETYFVRLSRALIESQHTVTAAIYHHPHKTSKRADHLRAMGAQVVTLPFAGRWDFYTRRKLAALSAQADGVIAFMSRAASLLSPPTAAPHIGRLGGYYDLNRFTNCDHLIANTPALADWITRQGWSEKYVSVIPNHAPIIKGSSPCTGKRQLLALGRYHPNKGFDILLNAVAMVPNAQLMLVGSGPLETKLRHQAEHLGITYRVKFLPWQSEISPLVHTCDLVVIPSRVEPLGNVVLDAWGHQRAVIASDVGGLSWLIDHERNGLLVPPENPEALADAIRRGLEDHHLITRLIQQGSQTFQDRFTAQRVIPQWINLIDRLRQYPQQRRRWRPE